MFIASHKKIIALLSIAVILIGGMIYIYRAPKASEEAVKKSEEIIPQNQISLTSKVSLTDEEKDQIVKSVDSFMNEYKLPKGVENSYKISVEKELGDSIQITINPGKSGDLGDIVVYARQTEGAWQVDQSSGPWCTLETFAERDCY